MSQEATLADLRQDRKNARRHNERNIGMIEESLRRVGVARSGVCDENNVLLAGNGTYDALARIGIERVRIVDADGDEWIVVRRKGLNEQQKREVSVVDNRAAELATWNIETLEAQGIELKPWFTDEELTKLKAITAGHSVEELVPPTALEYRIIVECTDEHQQSELLEELERRGYSCKLLIS